jgi:AcrR family transcriptional regulator
LRTTGRREELGEAATDYVLAHGLIGLSLRPLAAALGTSDRMLLYHFADKDDLVATVLSISNDRAVDRIEAIAPSAGVRQAVLDLWAEVTSPVSDRCQRLYVEAAALGLLGRQPYAAVVRPANGRWTAAVAAHLRASGMPAERADRAVVLLDAAFAGFHLDLPLEASSAALRQAVLDLADAIAAIAAPTRPGSSQPEGRA